MSQVQIDSRKFEELLLAEFPELQKDIDEHQGLDHLKMMEFVLFTQRAWKCGDWRTVARCLRVADDLLRRGNPGIQNAVYVSYLESLPRQGEVCDQLRKMMTPHLRKDWDDILNYLSKLGGS